MLFCYNHAGPGWRDFANRCMAVPDSFLRYGLLLMAAVGRFVQSQGGNDSWERPAIVMHFIPLSSSMVLEAGYQPLFLEKRDVGRGQFTRPAVRSAGLAYVSARKCLTIQTLRNKNHNGC